ncbi:SRPBCC family protein [Streptomyces sp. FXJ1.172]|uniref:SRPBCC family protein n=1 Tax=Streptomyces sp. FXJ1.172 TaxID=710705 RepID=UPI0007D01D33|nr:SRPBCC family protein [Streptomyces sp. FXJ1.172]WEO99970.1 SRPBCC family protein [Streptomyces sp. FXJ1.172]
MARTAQKTGRDEPSGLDRLRDELVGYAGAQVEHLADLAGDKVEGLTDQLLDVAENGGVLPKVGARVLQGDSPLKALIGEKAKDIKDSAAEKVSSLFGGGKGRKSGNPKVTTIIEHLDVGVPVRVAYDHWTRFEKFSSFTKGVRSVSQGDETSSDWKVKVGPSTRSWKATIQEQIPDERIMWTSDGAKGSTRGCVSFHEITPTLTHIVLVVEYYPSGFFEKTGNLWRAQGRRLRLDAKHFQRYVTLSDEDADGWRGEIRQGEVVRTHEEALEEEEAEYEDEEPEEGEEAPEDEEPEEGEEAPEDEYSEDETEDEYEDE